MNPTLQEIYDALRSLAGEHSISIVDSFTVRIQGPEHGVSAIHDARGWRLDVEDGNEARAPRILTAQGIAEEMITLLMPR